MKNCEGGTFYNIDKYLEKFSQYISDERDSKTS
jgi:hypothetical protein